MSRSQTLVQKLATQAMPLHQEDISNSAYFCREVESLMLRNRMGVMEAIIYLTEKHGIEPEFAADLLNASIKEKLTEEAVRLHQIPRTATLPL